MIPFLLISLESVAFVYFLSHMIRRGHDLYALAFLNLFIYTIFAQIGYVYFPFLSEIAGAYFGPQLFYKYWIFMFLSFLCTFAIYRFTTRNFQARVVYIVKKTRWQYGDGLFFFITIVLLILLSTYFVSNRSQFGYGGGRPMGPSEFGIGFWIFTLCTLIVYTLFRDHSNKKGKRASAFVLFIFCILFFLEVSISAGVRSPILYMFLSIVFYELSPVRRVIKFEKKKLLIISALCVVLFVFLSTLRSVRLLGEEISFSSLINLRDAETLLSGQQLYAVILSQDYYLPSHTLFISMHYNLVQPLTVFFSNIFNSLLGMEYPFMTSIIVEKVTGNVDERGAGWAYHYFVEGYNVAGMFGIFYNAVFFNLGMLLWISLCQSSSEKHNRLMQSIIVLVLALVMRSQNSAFIQFYWLILLPGLFLAMLANNYRISFHKNLKS
jgi:hypothetical protein